MMDTTRHPHHDAICAWADGHKISYSVEAGASRSEPTLYGDWVFDPSYSYFVTPVENPTPYGKYVELIKRWARGETLVEKSFDEGLTWHLEEDPLVNPFRLSSGTLMYRAQGDVSTHQVPFDVDGVREAIRYAVKGHKVWRKYGRDGYPFEAVRLSTLICDAADPYAATHLYKVSNEPTGDVHVHAEVIAAWLDGAKVQMENDYHTWLRSDVPLFYEHCNYRVDPSVNYVFTGNAAVDYIRNTTPHTPKARMVEGQVGYGSITLSHACAELKEKTTQYRGAARYRRDSYFGYREMDPAYCAPLQGEIVAAYIAAHAKNPADQDLAVETYEVLSAYYDRFFTATQYAVRSGELLAKFPALKAVRALRNLVADSGWKHVDISWLPKKYEHALHQSKDEPTKVAYYPTVKHYLDGRKPVKTTLGRYLGKYYPNVPESERKAIAEIYVAENTPIEVKIARSESEVIHAINDGPSDSCMAAGNYSGRKNWFKGHVHPAAIYGHPDDNPDWDTDIEVLYFEKLGEVKARVICNAATKECARIYGDAAKLKPAIEAMGYTQTVGALVGARVRKIENEKGRGYIMAYVDAGIGSGGGYLYLEDEDDSYWRLTDSESGESTYQGYGGSGVMNGGGEECSCCGDHFDEDEMSPVIGGDRVCDGCLSEDYVYGYTANGEGYMRRNDAIWCRTNEEWYLEDDANECGVHYCQVRYGWYHEDEMVSVRQGMVHVEEAAALDRSYRGEDWALSGEVVYTSDDEVIHEDAAAETHDGRTIHEDDQVVCSISDRVYHEDDDDIEKVHGGYVSHEAAIENPGDIWVSDTGHLNVQGVGKTLEEYLLSCEQDGIGLLYGVHGQVATQFVLELDELMNELIDSKEETIEEIAA